MACQAWQYLLFIQTGGLLSVEVHVGNVRVLIEKAAEVIRCQSGFRNIGIQAAGPVAGFDNIPQGDVVLAEFCQSRWVIQFRSRCE